MSPLIGNILLCALVVTQTAIAIEMLGWCPLCAPDAPTLKHGGEWGTCEIVGSETWPACGGGSALGGPEPNCHLEIVTQYLGAGQTREIERLVCEILEAASLSQNAPESG